ncbi:MAG: Snf7 family protein [Exiguobacterium sp.]
MFGWRTSPEATLAERRKVSIRALRDNARKQDELRKTIKELDAAVRRETDPQEKRRLAVALIQKRKDLDHTVESASRTHKSLNAMDRGSDTIRRLEDSEALAASMSAMSRKASPESVAKTQEMLMTAQAKMDMTDDLLNSMDQRDANTEFTVEDEANELLEQLDSEKALDIGGTMPAAPSFPPIPISASSSDPPSPHPTVRLDDIEERLRQLCLMK